MGSGSMPSKLQRGLAADLADERKAVKDYGERARQARASNRPIAAAHLEAIRRDEMRHAATVATVKRAAEVGDRLGAGSHGFRVHSK